SNRLGSNHANWVNGLRSDFSREFANRREEEELQEELPKVPSCPINEVKKDEVLDYGEIVGNLTLQMLTENETNARLIGGRIVDKFGSKKVGIVVGLIDILGNFLTPLAVKTHYGLLILIRILMGMFMVGSMPFINTVATVWMPKNEISRYFSFIMPGIVPSVIYYIYIYIYIYILYIYIYIY
ncbi:hypothetical protein Avbf_03435, partial [Armadillidium vulgare]